MFNLFRKSSPSPLPPAPHDGPVTSPQMRKAQEAMQKHAQQLAKTHGVKLDYTPESIERVETILLTVRQGVREDTNEPDLTALEGIALALGAYIVTVADKNFGQGLWEADQASTPPRFPYTNHDAMIYPVEWCMDALTTDGTDISKQWETFASQLTPGN